MGRKVINMPALQIISAASYTSFENHAFFKTLNEQPDIAWMITPDASGLWFNKAWCDFSGRTIEDMRDWAWHDHVPMEEVPRTAASFFHALTTGEKWECVFSQRGVKGIYRQFLARAVPVYNSRGEIKYWLGNETDITDYVRPEKLLSR